MPQSNLNSFSLNPYIQTTKKASISPALNSINVNKKTKRRQNITPQYSLLNNLDVLDIILLMILGVFCIAYVSSSLLSTIFIAILSLIPAQIASNKGRKFIRWYCYGFYNFFIALIFILLLNENYVFLANKKSALEKQQIEIEDREKAYFLMFESVTLPIEQLETKLLQTVLGEFIKLQARVAVGISYNDFPAVLAPAKLVVQEFERSKDYTISSILSDLITKIMFMYELSQECMRRKAYCAHLFTYPSYGGIGIPTTSEFGKVIEKEFPTLPKKYVSFGSYCYDDTTIQYIWAKAAEYSNILEKFLKGS